MSRKYVNPTAVLKAARKVVPDYKHAKLGTEDGTPVLFVPHVGLSGQHMEITVSAEEAARKAKLDYQPRD